MTDATTELLSLLCPGISPLVSLYRDTDEEKETLTEFRFLLGAWQQLLMCLLFIYYIDIHAAVF